MHNPDSEKPIVGVVAGVIVFSNGSLLVAQRRRAEESTEDSSGFWEFPGGKIEPGESPERALERELKEELGVETRTGLKLYLSQVDESHRVLRISFFQSTIIAGLPLPLEHQALQILTPEALLRKSLPFHQADAEFVSLLQENPGLLLRDA